MRNTIIVLISTASLLGCGKECPNGHHTETRIIPITTVAGKAVITNLVPMEVKICNDEKTHE